MSHAKVTSLSVTVGYRPGSIFFVTRRTEEQEGKGEQEQQILVFGYKQKMWSFCQRQKAPLESAVGRLAREKAVKRNCSQALFCLPPAFLTGAKTGWLFTHIYINHGLEKWKQSHIDLMTFSLRTDFQRA